MSLTTAPAFTRVRQLLCVFVDPPNQRSRLPVVGDMKDEVDRLAAFRGVGARDLVCFQTELCDGEDHSFGCAIGPLCASLLHDGAVSYLEGAGYQVSEDGNLTVWVKHIPMPLHKAPTGVDSSAAGVGTTVNSKVGTCDTECEAGNSVRFPSGGWLYIAGKWPRDARGVSLSGGAMLSKDPSLVLTKTEVKWICAHIEADMRADGMHCQSANIPRLVARRRRKHEQVLSCLDGGTDKSQLSSQQAGLIREEEDFHQQWLGSEYGKLWQEGVRRAPDKVYRSKKRDASAEKENDKSSADAAR